jgi:putative endonuclease
MSWIVYLLECADQTYYTGITNRLEHRIEMHNKGLGAKYTRGRGPVTLLGQRAYPDRASASRAEAYVKRLRKIEKLAFFSDDELEA